MLSECATQNRMYHIWPPKTHSIKESHQCLCVCVYLYACVCACVSVCVCLTSTAAHSHVLWEVKVLSVSVRLPQRGRASDT